MFLTTCMSCTRVALLYVSSRHSSILEIGLALIEEGVHTLLLIMSGKQGMEQPSLKPKTLRQSHFRSSIDGLLGHDRSHLSLLGNSEAHVDGLLNKIVGGEHSLSLIHISEPTRPY